MSWGEDLIMWVTGKTLCCILETNITQYINYILIYHIKPGNDFLDMTPKETKE